MTMTFLFQASKDGSMRMSLSASFCGSCLHTGAVHHFCTILSSFSYLPSCRLRMAEKYPSLARRRELEKKKATMSAMEYLEQCKKPPQDLMFRVHRLREKPDNWDDSFPKFPKDGLLLGKSRIFLLLPVDKFKCI